MIVLFDLNGTLTDPSGLGEPWDRPELGLAMLNGAIRTAIVDAVSGHCRPFAKHLRAAIAREAQLAGLDGALVDAAAERATHLDPFADTEQALDLLRDAGHRLAVLTNSGADGGRRTLERAGIADRFEAVLGVDAVGSYKPDPRTYAHAVAQLGAAAHEILFVAAHAWDVTGAARAGMRTGWVSRGEEVLSAMTPEPDVRAGDLLELARAVLAA